MAMKPLAIAGCAVLGLAVILGAMSAFTVQETERAVVLQFGKPVHVIPEAGLYFKVPLIQEVRYLDKRTLSVDPGIDTMNLSVDKGDTAQAQPTDMTPEMKAELEKLATSSGGMQIKVEGLRPLPDHRPAFVHPAYGNRRYRQPAYPERYERRDPRCPRCNDAPHPPVAETE